MKNAFNLYKRDYNGEETLYLNYHDINEMSGKIDLKKYQSLTGTGS
ncbi:hypothetical protein [Helicobacter pylori]|nr:hypothetical protein [Helicobacter pylori]MDZ5288463.1 hypothetical protein [Helicobacter pylori]